MNESLCSFFCFIVTISVVSVSPRLPPIFDPVFDNHRRLSLLECGFARNQLFPGARIKEIYKKKEI